MLIHYIDTVDGLTNGCLGLLVDVLKTTNGKVDKLIIEFTNPKQGELKRQSNAAGREAGQLVGRGGIGVR